MDHLTDTGSPSAEKVTPAKMDAALKAKWVEALRSDEFKQNFRSVGHVFDKRLCCLGVGAVVCSPHIKKLATTDDALDILQNIGGFPGYEDRERGRYTELAQSLIDLNDIERAPFSEIADYIEKNL